MDFVASRAEEKAAGWRNRVGEFLRSLGVTVFDPWNKPEVRGLQEYGQEDVHSINARENWSFASDEAGVQARGECASGFWETLHIDLRMVDISDLVIAYCPTNIYSVGTVHEIVVARQQHKPVFLVSPPIGFPSLAEIEKLAEGDARLAAVLDKLRIELPIKRNPDGIPSLWYMPLVGSECFFDGFGFGDRDYRERFSWSQTTNLDSRERTRPPRRPLLPYIEQVNNGLMPKRWDPEADQLVPNDDWLLLEHEL
jgi:hypothetical protein